MDHKTAQEFFEIREQVTQTIADRLDASHYTRADCEGLAETLLMDYDITAAADVGAGATPTGTTKLQGDAWSAAASGMLDHKLVSYMSGSISRGPIDADNVIVEYRSPNGIPRSTTVTRADVWFEVLS